MTQADKIGFIDEYGDKSIHFEKGGVSVYFIVTAIIINKRDLNEIENKVKELKSKYDALILTIGSQRGTLIGCEGEDAENIFSGIDFLRNMEMTGQRYDFKGKRIAVIGGGNTAMDCCRTSIRCGSTDVTVVYRRTEAEMPANPIEIHE